MNAARKLEDAQAIEENKSMPEEKTQQQRKLVERLAVAPVQRLGRPAERRAHFQKCGRPRERRRHVLDLCAS